jgi:SsrA-binding protein
MTKKSKRQTGHTAMAVNKKATHDYFIEERFETGLVLEGWEVKSLRDKRVQLKESYVTLTHRLHAHHSRPTAHKKAFVAPPRTHEAHRCCGT